jgi:hypothetical protein
MHRRAIAAAAVVAALVTAAGALAGAAQAPNQWDHAQVGLTYPVYEPTATLGLRLAKFALLPCTPGQDESVFAEYGNAYKGRNFGRVRGFSIGEGYPTICANAGIAKHVGTRTVNGARVRVSVYCDPTERCTLADGLTHGYVLQWRQPFRLTLPELLRVSAGLRPVL